MKTPISIEALRASACAHLNPHLFPGGQPAKVNAKKASKYGNKAVEVDGIRFDSMKEAKRYGELRMMQKAGEIGFLERQVLFPLMTDAGKLCDYHADFVYLDQKTGMRVVEDVKSEATQKNRVYRLKKKLMKQLLNIEIKEV